MCWATVSTANPVCGSKTRKTHFPANIVRGFRRWLESVGRALERGKAGYPSVSRRQRARGSGFSGGSSLVAMMKPAHLRYRHDSPPLRWLNRSRFGRVLAQAKDASSIAEELAAEHPVMTTSTKPNFEAGSC